MAAEVPVKTKSLEGISDLTLLAPIRSGLIDGPDTRTYETRLRILLKTLNTLRVAAREYAPMRPFVDTIERIQTIHSFRLAIVGEADAPKLLLAVTFDRPWEPYIRLIHRDASAEFLAALDGVTDPEATRKIIGAKFIEVF